MFSLNKKNDATIPVIKEFPVAEGTYNVGDACDLNATSGLMTKVTGTTKPNYICASKGTASASDVLAFNPIYDDCEYVTTFSADASALKVGAKVTIGSDSAQVTATTTNGVATIVEKLGTGAVGTKVVVKF